VLKGLAKLNDSYKIKLKDDATPFALIARRQVPIPLLPKEKEELLRMENVGVITRIDEPTNWCVDMVVVPKQKGNVRICVDLKMNESVCRKRLILPSVEKHWPRLGEESIFQSLMLTLDTGRLS